MNRRHFIITQRSKVPHIIPNTTIYDCFRLMLSNNVNKYHHRKDDTDANLLKKNKHQISNHDAHKPQTTISMDLFHTVFVSQCYNPSFPYQTYKNHHDASSSLKHNASQHLLPTHISHPDQNFPP